MRIVADTDILSVQESFSELGELVTLPGREISRRQLLQADALLVRSITPVNRELLEGTPVRFVGTATSGIDHVAVDYLKERGIQFAHAGGCNANAVVDYCFAALSQLPSQLQEDFTAREFAVIGAGHVGGRFASRLAGLGIACQVHDPFLAARRRRELEACGVQFVGLERALQASVISLHVPLTTDGEHPTFHLFDAGRLSRLEPGTILLNSARGAVIAGDALLKVLRDRPDLQVVLDVWEGEPQIDTRLLERVVIGTPHIAGYSMEAKLYATYRLREELCRYLRLPTAGVDKPNASSSLQLSVTRSGRGAENDRFCRSVLGQVLSLDSLTGQLRQSLAVSPGQEAAVFDRLRRQLAGRREFSAWRVTATGYTPAQLEFLKMVGFQISRH